MLPHLWRYSKYLTVSVVAVAFGDKTEIQWVAYLIKAVRGMDYRSARTGKCHCSPVPASVIGSSQSRVNVQWLKVR